MNSKNAAVLVSIFEDPARADIRWDDIESLIRALGAEVVQGRGSRVRVTLNGVRSVFHEPHPDPAISRSSARSVRRFLLNAGIDSE